jgi:hypothetical protein
MARRTFYVIDITEILVHWYATVVSRSCCELEDGEWSVGSAAGPSGGFGDVSTSGQM